MTFHKLAVALTDQLMQAAAANRENTSKRENTSMQSMMCVRLFIENEHDTQQLTTTRRWSPLCGWNVIAVSSMCFFENKEKKQNIYYKLF